MADPQPKKQVFNIYTEENLDVLSDGTLNRSEVKIFLYLLLINKFAGDDQLPNLVKTGAILTDLALSRSTYYRAIARLKDLKAIPLRILLVMPRQSETYRNYKKLIKDGLHLRLGGQKDFVTVTGKLDLLTETELIQVGGLENWKTTLSRILPIGALFPQHKKRIHLYGDTSQISKLDRIKQACEPFDVLVSGEEV
ncbi:MAG: hypothetical protein KME46_33735 [Brasilonema angustatum HA4187-MV1]|jgi:hypothetical protein|nr:hypothetical protein [Brasilonema angustatum HA4187-MV1]